MSREVIPQGDALQLWLALLAGSEPRTSLFEIRARRVAGDGFEQDWIPLFESERAARAILNRGQMSDTYVGVAPRTRPAGTLEAIERVWCVWADCDGQDVLRRLVYFRPAPTIVIRSGSAGHAHAYWALREPAAPEWVKRANKRLALRLGADPNAVDAARIMRPPGTLNFKHQRPAPVICTRLELDTYNLRDVVAGLPDPTSQPSRAPRAQRDAPTSAEGLIRTVREAQPGNRNHTLFWAACRAADDSLDIWEDLRAAAVDAGLGESEITATLASAEGRAAA